MLQVFPRCAFLGLSFHFLYVFNTSFYTNAFFPHIVVTEKANNQMYISVRTNYFA